MTSNGLHMHDSTLIQSLVILCYKLLYPLHDEMLNQCHVSKWWLICWDITCTKSFFYLTNLIIIYYNIIHFESAEFCYVCDFAFVLCEGWRWRDELIRKTEVTVALCWTHSFQCNNSELIISGKNLHLHSGKLLGMILERHSIETSMKI